jgi:hypothetical protein
MESMSQMGRHGSSMAMADVENLREKMRGSGDKM